MANRKNACPKCKGIMQQGFVPDFAHGSVLVSCWHPGQPQESFWRGTKASANEGVPIGAFRCIDCGFLEFYAERRFAAE